MDRLLDSAIGQIGGWLAVSTGIGTGVVELVSHWRVDNTVQLLLSLGGLVFICFKINNSRIDTKIKKQELKKLKKENED
tara:strand:+ start:2937 stop:3173 length:237 start_codon:yes stop_codon:yes gene_type:complete